MTTIIWPLSYFQLQKYMLNFLKLFHLRLYYQTSSFLLYASLYLLKLYANLRLRIPFLAIIGKIKTRNGNVNDTILCQIIHLLPLWQSCPKHALSIWKIERSESDLHFVFYVNHNSYIQKNHQHEGKNHHILGYPAKQLLFRTSVLTFLSDDVTIRPPCVFHRCSIGMYCDSDDTFVEQLSYAQSYL